jgi:hypothetical protein
MFRASIFELMAWREAEIVCLGCSCDGDGEDIREIESSGRLSEARIPGYSEKAVVEEGREITEITLPKVWLTRAIRRMNSRAPISLPCGSLVSLQHWLAGSRPSCLARSASAYCRRRLRHLRQGIRGHRTVNASSLILKLLEVFYILNQCALIFVTEIMPVVMTLVLDEVRAGAYVQEPLQHGRLTFGVICDAQLAEL